MCQAIGEDRFYRTGDLGVMNSDGNLRIVGRLKELIIRGGSNIYPAEIEQVGIMKSNNDQLYRIRELT